MSLGSTFWNALGDGCRWLQVLTYGADGTTDLDCVPVTTIPNMRIHIVGAKLFQKPCVTGGAGGNQNVNDGYDTGYFALIDSATDPLSDTKYTSMMATSIGVGGSLNPRPQWKQVGTGQAILGSPYVTQGEFFPAVSGTNLYRAIYQTGFIANVGDQRWTYGGFGWDMLTWIQWPSASTRRYWLWHYQPWAWFGAVPQVIADIVMKCGMPADYIDQAAFDNAYDAYDLTTGDNPWTSAGGGRPIDNLWFGMATKWEIGCSRTVGEKCIDLIMKCAGHARDLYFVKEDGLLSVASFTRPATHSGLSLEDGLIGDVDWSWASDLIFNTAYVTWGAAVRTSGDFMTNPAESDFSVSDEPNIESYAGNKLSATAANAASVAKYGELMLPGHDVTVNIGGQPIDVKRLHYPYLLTNNCSQFNSELAHIHYWLASDAKDRRFVTITQDFRALDWGIGAKVLNVAVTDDGQTIPEMWCIERTYDFDRLTVTSVLMEQPANT